MRSLLVTLLLIAVTPSSSLVDAQPAARPLRVGVLGGSESSVLPPIAYGLPGRLSLRGYLDGTDVIVQSRFAQDNAELPAHAAAMVASGLEVLVADGAPAVAAVARVPTSPPIVGVWAGGSVRPPFSAPGPGLTGVVLERSNRQRLEALQALVPGLTRVAVIGSLAGPDDWADVERAARSLGVDLHRITVQPPDDVDAILRDVQGSGAGAILVPDGAPRGAVVQLQSARADLPIIFPQAYFVRPPQQGLLSFGVDAGYVNDRVAALVDKILRGAKAEDLPVELISKFELVINRRRAHELRLTIPPAILRRATTVIE